MQRLRYTSNRPAGWTKLKDALFVLHPALATSLPGDVGIAAMDGHALDDLKLLRTELARRGVAGEMLDWTLQQWMNDGAVFLRIGPEEGAIFVADEPAISKQEHKIWIEPSVNVTPFLPISHFYSEHGQPEPMKYCDLVPVTVWPPDVQKKVRAYQRAVAKEQARKETEYDELERKRKEEEEFRQAGFPPHLDYIPRPPEE